MLWCELAAPQAVSLGGKVTAGDAAAAVSLQPEDFVIAYEPQEASVGLSFLMAGVRDRATLRRAQVNLDGMEALIGQGVTPDVHLFTRADDGFDLRVRMFAPLDGVPEDPATGSANCALAGMLALRHADVDGDFSFRIAQGVEMGRPSVLDARAEKRDGKVTGTWIGGCSVMVADGQIEVDDKGAG